MAISVTTGATKGRSNDVVGSRKVTRLRVTLDSAYPTGGEAFNPRNFGCDHVVDIVRITQREPVDVAYVFVYDHAAAKIVAFWVDTTVDGAALAEVANGTDLSDVVLDVEVTSD